MSVEIEIVSGRVFCEEKILGYLRLKGEFRLQFTQFAQTLFVTKRFMFCYLVLKTKHILCKNSVCEDHAWSISYW